ncbi:MAG TPA: DUF5103 domain-containing protein [Bacteroidales bacterium]|nr:DUF5103 domain-containing protein [Bacteroidales bacterium]HRZ48869.1 DUF5103 domain-containing protein [Bacteroidales bacterium]
MKKTCSSLIFLFATVLLLYSCRTPQSADATGKILTTPAYSSLSGFSWFNPVRFSTLDHAYTPAITSVKMQRTGVEFSLPLLELDKSGQLEISFDELNGLPRQFRYTLIHCDASWNPSDLLQSEYLSPYTEGFLNQYLLSRATRQAYVHYTLLIPNEEVKISKSGNYLLVIYDPAQQNQLILTRRFMVTENRASLKISVRKSSDIEEAGYKQEVDVDLVKSSWPVENPYQELKIFIAQNGRLDNRVEGLQPRLVTGNTISYNWEKVNTFNGGNEFRYFDIRTLSKVTPRVAFITQDSAFHHVFLKPDFKRGFQVYQSEKDLNGEFIIRNDDAHSTAGNEEDYAWVHFTFPFQSSFGHRDMYLLGAFTNWQLTPEARLVYSEERNSYEASLYLKQGYYNYHYVMLDSAGTRFETVLTEGDHSETENFYTVYVYQKLPSELYDRLIAVERVTTLQQR